MDSREVAFTDGEVVRRLFTAAGEVFDPNDEAAVDAALNRVIRSDAPEVRAVRARVFAEDPGLASEMADVAARTERLARRLVQSADGWSPEAVEAHCAHLRAELGFDTAPPLVRLAIQRVIVTWLHSEALYQRAASIWFAEVGGTNANVAFLNREAARANGEFARATRSLAQIEKLLRPRARVQQVNVAMPGSQQANAIIEGDD